MAGPEQQRGDGDQGAYSGKSREEQPEGHSRPVQRGRHASSARQDSETLV